MLSEAEDIISTYIELLNQPDVEGKIARDISLLPYAKETIVAAYKVYMCFVAIFQTATNDEVTSLLQSLNKLNSFIDNDEADYFELLNKRIGKREQVSKKEIVIMGDYMMTSTMYEKHDEVIEVLINTQKFVYEWTVNLQREINSQELYEYIYVNQIGLEYKREYGEEFYVIGMKRLKRQWN